MDRYVLSSDNVKIHYNETGNGKITIVFVHGWLGNSHWWKSQELYFKQKYNVVEIDLAGHGKSEGQDSTGQAFNIQMISRRSSISLIHLKSSLLVTPCQGLMSWKPVSVCLK